MTRQEYNQGLEYLALRYPGFDFTDETVQAWYEDLQDVPLSLWFVCLKLIVREEDQWWTKNLIALVHSRVERARRIIADKQDEIKAKEDKEALPERMSEEETKERLSELYEAVGIEKL